MAKRTITKWWIFAAVALASSAILTITDGVALADHLAALPVGSGQGLTPDDFSRNVVVLIILGLSVAAILRWSTLGLVPIVAGALIAPVVSRQTNADGLLQGQTCTALVLLTTCVVLAVCGVMVEPLPWWAALFTARRLADQRWFTLLACSGIASALTMPLLGLGALIAVGVGIAYRNAAPDALANDNSPTSGHAVTAWPPPNPPARRLR